MKRKALFNLLPPLSLILALVASLTSSQTVVAVGSGVFADSGQSLGSFWTWVVALGDVDGDGDLDAFTANTFAQPNKVWLNDGMGVFSDSGQSLGNSYSDNVALGDVDGDGDLDAFVANGIEANRVWLNDGTGVFSDSGQNLGNSNSQGLVLGDVDGDGDLDAFVANGHDQANKVWLNNGTGTFGDSGQNLGSSYSLDVALGDVDGDGDLDAFVANGQDQPNKVWLNDGTGIFGDSGQNLGGLDSSGVALGDVDGDGDLDAFVANGWHLQLSKVWLNDGMGTFSDSGQNLANSYYGTAVALGDVDDDGDLDAFVSDNQANKVWLNDGVGVFSDSGQNLGSAASQNVALGDVDGDYDLDAFVANGGFQANKVWLNINANQPPDCSAAAPSIETIWPPNHKFVSVNVLGVTDPDGDPVSITIDSIWQDEPVDTTGDGRFSPDGQGVGTDTAQVRAERVGTKKAPGNGRVYHISFTADDGHGGFCSGEILVGVPHNRGSVPVDDGRLYDSTVAAP